VISFSTCSDPVWTEWLVDGRVHGVLNMFRTFQNFGFLLGHTLWSSEQVDNVFDTVRVIGFFLNIIHF
jgi:hypothetical protein